MEQSHKWMYFSKCEMIKQQVYVFTGTDLEKKLIQ